MVVVNIKVIKLWHR